MANNKQSSQNTDESTNKPFQFMIRPCDVYDDEYSECTSIKGRFHQYFIDGTTSDCTSWKRDYENCKKLENTPDDMKAYNELIESEKHRRRERLTPHFQNNIWRKRRSPPADWNKPLPEWLQQENENTFLAMKAQEMKDPDSNTLPEQRTLCVIL